MSVIPRRSTRPLRVGGVMIGGNSPISVQSMTKTDTRDIAATVQQINELESLGCEIVRLAVVDTEAATAIKAIRQQTRVPLIADIHFDYRLALACLENGINGLRINPGNIGDRSRVEMVARKAQDIGVPIRIGVNAGSLEKALIEQYGGVTPEALVESALKHIRILENLRFYDIKVSIKASRVPLMIKAYRNLARKVDYPLHLGVTEAGTRYNGTIKSAIGIGTLLSEGIGDTIRVSLTGPPNEEVRVGYEILKALNLRERGPEIISCPTCGRCQIDLLSVVEQVEAAIRNYRTPLTVAIMGCVVNGPGEARHADVGIAGGKGVGLLFKDGQPVRKVKEDELVKALINEIEKIEQETIRDSR
ncbi:MAG: flavodoxin-dependent (E)-4-hydroxy-3-methylbut-2-enyl-diphosphate synthase [Syntrophomonadaceae bacterium]|nr:flavodoxin-dependent (E)-4-hydroxy-3-methylbut-2-enyl-diphosphate synthase [Syntrophomonadaceae bacterium]